MILTTKNIIKSLYEAVEAYKSFAVRMFALFLVFVISSCGKPPEQCIEAENFGDQENIVVNVDPSRPLTASGIRVKRNEKIQVRVSGIVDLCANDMVYGPINPESYGYAGVNKDYLIDASINTWQEAVGAGPFESGDNLTIKINGDYKDRKSYDPHNQTPESGLGLYAYIGVNPPQDVISKQTGVDHNVWYGIAFGGPEHSKAIKEYTNYSLDEENNLVPIEKSDGKSFKFFHLNDNGTAGSGGSGYSLVLDDNIVPPGQKAKLWFKYARTADAVGMDYSGGHRQNPWMGQYAWDDPNACRACMQSVILPTCTALIAVPYIGYTLRTICIISWEASCKAAGRLEVPSGRRSGLEKCREYDAGIFDGPGDHWIDNKYDGSEKINPGTGEKPHRNKGGYKISVNNGCVGTYGEYMEMEIGESTVKYVDKTIPRDCSSLADPDQCIYVTSPTGCSLGEPGCSKIQVPEFSFLGGSSKTNMDLRKFGGAPTQNPPYIAKGLYRGTVPETGELWFRINDTAATAENPNGGYYEDNNGEYQVQVITKKEESGFSDAMNKIIYPIRGIIFGYCRISQDNMPAGIALTKAQFNTSEEDCGDAWQAGVTKRLYNKMIGGTRNPETGRVESNPFLNAIRALLVLYVAFYGITFMIGFVDANRETFITRVLKFSVIVVLISDSSWEFFNKYMFAAFIDGLDDMISIMTGQFANVVSNFLVDPVTGEALENAAGNKIPVSSNGGSIFAFADVSMGMFFNDTTFSKVWALMWSGPVGFIFTFVIVIGMLLFAYSLIKALVLYLLSLLAVSLLLIVAPLFIAFLLFDYTKTYFEAWWNSLLNYVLQPMLVFTALSIFNIFVYSSLFMLLYYRVCPEPIITMDLGSVGIDIPEITLVKDYAVGKIPLNFFMILIFVIMTTAMLGFIKWMATFAARITVLNESTSLSTAAGKTLNSVVKDGINAAFAVGSMGLSAATGAALGSVASAGKESKGIGGKLQRGDMIAGAMKGAMGGLAGGIKGQAMKSVKNTMNNSKK